MKLSQDTPEEICPSNLTNYVVYSDTDSIYVYAEPLLEALYPNFKELPGEEKDNILEKVAIKYQDVITKYYDTLTQDCFNIQEHRLEMKTEAVIRAAYFRATRRYAQWITKEEGVVKENLDIKGLEFQKSNFPPVFGEFFHGIVEQVLKGAQKDDIIPQIKDFKKKILEGEIPLPKLGNPTAIKKLDKYTGKKKVKKQVFTPIKKGAPAPVKASIKYNDLLKLWGLDKKYPLITQADKVKWAHLKDNSYKIEALAFFEGEIPEKIDNFLSQYADRQKIFDTILLKKLEGFFSDLSWEFELNPHIEKFQTISV